MLMRSGCRHPANYLLPSYVNGSLEGEAATAVRDHLTQCDICSRECDDLQLLAGMVGRHGPNPGAGASRSSWPPGLRTAALFLLPCLGLGVLLALSGLWKGGWREAAPSKEQGKIAVFDLGAGLSRGRDGPPVLHLPSSASSVRLFLYVPVRPGARYWVEIRDEEERVLMTGMPLEPPDSLGKAGFLCGAETLRSEGDRELLVHREEGDSRDEVFRYPFTILLSPGDAVKHD